MRGARQPAARPGGEVASLLLPALVRAEVGALARGVARAAGAPERAPRVARHLAALAGRLLAPGGWCAAMPRVGAEPWSTGRSRPYDESTLRKAARALTAAGAVPIAQDVLRTQVARAVGGAEVTAFTDVYDQVYWTKKAAWAGPVGSLNNRRLACTYFGLTFVRAGATAPLLALHVSWHKPASPLRDALEHLHAEPARATWLRAHVALHVLDRGSNGDPTLRWCLAQGVPYLTLSKASAQWRRFRTPTHQTALGVPIFVRPDRRLATGGVTTAVRTTAPRVIVFPARPDKGPTDGRAIRYRTAAALTDAQIETLDGVYKARWPSNENPIKALVAVGFDRNLDRTLDPTTSRGHDGEVRRRRDDLAALDAQLAALMPQPIGQVGRRFATLSARRERQAAKLAAVEAAATKQGTRTDRGGEHLCKLLALLLYNALTLLLWCSPIEAVRAMTPARVRDLLLGRPALGVLARGRVTLYIEPMTSPADQALQTELVRLVNEARLRSPSGKIEVRIRDPAREQPQLRISA